MRCPLEGWQTMETAPIDGVTIWGLSTHGKVEKVMYIADGDFKDRWGWGNMRLNCIAWQIYKEGQNPPEPPKEFRR